MFEPTLYYATISMDTHAFPCINVYKYYYNRRYGQHMYEFDKTTLLSNYIKIIHENDFDRVFYDSKKHEIIIMLVVEDGLLSIRECEGYLKTILIKEAKKNRYLSRILHTFDDYRVLIF